MWDSTEITYKTNRYYFPCSKSVVVLSLVCGGVRRQRPCRVLISGAHGLLIGRYGSCVTRLKCLNFLSKLCYFSYRL
jgi:hypothetical protein